MLLYLKSLTSSNVSLTGDEGLPNLSIPAGATKTVLASQVTGNAVFCDSCASLIDGGHLEVRVASSTGHVLTSSEMDAVKNGSYFDFDENGVVDTADTAAEAAIPASVLTERGSIIFRDATEATELTHGTSGQFLSTGGHDADPSWATPPDAIAGGASGYMTGADKTKLDGIETAADVTDATNVAAAGAVMDGDFTADGRMVRTGAGTYTTIKDSLANTIAPTADNDASGGAGGKEMGFAVGSLWIDTTADKAYLCVDPTNTSAVWLEVPIGSDYVAKTVLTTTGDLLTASGASTPDRIAAGALGTVLVGLGAGVKPAFQAVAGLATDVLDAVIVAADVGGGGADTTLAVDLKDLAGAAATRVGIVKVLAQSTQYGGEHAIQTHVTYSAATKGSILASGSGWAVVKTDANGQFACTLSNASDETVYFTACTTDGGHDALAAGVIIRGCIPDDATWSA